MARSRPKKYAQHERAGVNDYCAVNNHDPPVRARLPCKTDRTLHCFTWTIVKHNEVANFWPPPRDSRSSCVAADRNIDACKFVANERAKEKRRQEKNNSQTLRCRCFPGSRGERAQSNII